MICSAKRIRIQQTTIIEIKQEIMTAGGYAKYPITIPIETIMIVIKEI